jgi:ribosomal protein S18 acetylase RimI-like enzyme
LLIDTSGQDEFAATRGFYAKNGYQQVGIIPDYYGPGDSRISLWKALT